MAVDHRGGPARVSAVLAHIDKTSTESALWEIDRRGCAVMLGVAYRRPCYGPRLLMSFKFIFQGQRP